MAPADAALRETAVPTARAAARAVAGGQLTARALVEHCLARIDALEGSVHAWAHVDAEGARQAADARDAHRLAGLPLGPLHGVPVGVKDTIDVEGMPCARGLALEAGRTPLADAVCVARLRAAGAVILGKTVTTELAGYPPSKTRNPHNPERSPGGSSSGSAAAVAAGMAPLAIGSQTNGSVIRPAAYCGVFAIKPSFGSLPRTGVMANAPSLDHLGLFARALEDLSLIDVLTGPDGRDPDATPYVGPTAATADSAPPVSPSLAWAPTHAWAKAEPALEAAFSEFCAALPGPIDTVPLPSLFDETPQLVRSLMAAEGADVLGHYLDTAELGAPNRQLIEEGRTALAADYLRAKRMQKTFRDGLDEVFERYDAIVTPATTGEAPGPDSTGDPAFCSLWTYTGLPSLTLPLLTGPNGLPIGVQMVGRLGDDARLLRTARWTLGALTEGDA